MSSKTLKMLGELHGSLVEGLLEDYELIEAIEDPAQRLKARRDFERRALDFLRLNKVSAASMPNMPTEELREKMKRKLDFSGMREKVRPLRPPSAPEEAV